MFCNATLTILTSCHFQKIHIMLKQEFYSSLKDNELIKIIYLMMQNRQFYITLEGKKADGEYKKTTPPRESSWLLSYLICTLMTNQHLNIKSIYHIPKI